MAKGKINSNQETKKILCSCCSRTLSLTSSNFYKSSKPEYEKTEGFCYVCKQCIRGMAYSSDNTINLEGLKQALEMLDKPFIKSEYMKILSKGSFDIGTYLKNVSFNSYKGWTYADSDNEDNIKKETTRANVDTNDRYTDTTPEEVEITENDIQIQKDVMKLLGYDPFAGYSRFDRKFLYAELLPYLDEDTVDDQYKCSVLLQIVNNNNQIRKMDLVINRLSSDTDSLLKNSGEIKNLTAIKKQIGEVNDKLSKENSIALKHRGDSKSNKSTLGSIMKDLRELGFEKAEHDYYDMLKCEGMKISADISNKSIMEILHFDDNDFNNMFKMQREEIQKLQNSELSLKEQIRVLLKENNELKQKLKDI